MPLLFEWRKALCDSDATLIEKAVGHVLAMYMNADGACFPSIPTIARGASCSKRTVHNALAGLESRGLLRIKRGRGLRHPNRYKALLPAGQTVREMRL